MKKVLLSVFLMLAVAISLFADGGVVESGTLTSGDAATNVDAKIKYTLSTAGEDAVSTYQVGFSTTPVRDLNSTVTPASEIKLVVGDDFKGRIAEDSSVYVFWKIASPVNCDIELTPGAMTDGNTPGKTLHITFSTTDKLSMNVDSDLYPVTNTVAGSLDKTILNYLASTSTEGGNNNQCAGSQKINIETDNISGLAAGTYSGELTLTITAKG